MEDSNPKKHTFRRIIIITLLLIVLAGIGFLLLRFRSVELIRYYLREVI